MADFTYSQLPNFDYLIEEKGNMFGALRKYQWGSSSEYKLDLRKYIATETGEKMMKGYAFMTDDGAHELVRTMIELGYGKPDEILETIKANRQDIYARAVKDALELPKATQKKLIQSIIIEDTEEQMYDLREVI